MQTYVALLYSIILGEGRRVVMADLKAMAEGLGLKNPRTLVATGNLVFEARATDIGQAGTAAGNGLRKNLRPPCRHHRAHAEDWLKLAAGNPFPAESAEAAIRWRCG